MHEDGHVDVLTLIDLPLPAPTSAPPIPGSTLLGQPDAVEATHETGHPSGP